MRAHALLLLLLPLAACGGSDAQCVIDTDCSLFERCMAQRCVPLGGGDAAVDTSVPTDSAPTDGSSMDSATDTGPSMLGSGSVYISQTPIVGAGASYAVSAGFVREGSGASPCTVTDSAPCTVTECVTAPPGDAGVGDAGMPTIPHAGSIDISGAMMDLSLTPSLDGTYPPATGTGLLFSGGEMLNVTAAGDEVPAFARSVTAPPTIDVTSPSVAMGLLSIDRSMDLNVAWSATMVDADVIVRLTGFEMASDGGSRTVSLACTYDSASGSGTVPAGALGSLPGGGASGSFSVEASGSTTLMAGGWNVSITASATGRGDSGGAASAGVSYP